MEATHNKWIKLLELKYIAKLWPQPVPFVCFKLKRIFDADNIYIVFENWLIYQERMACDK